MPFLKASWRKLLLVNYAIDPALLIPYLPAGTELDIWQGTCYVSLVGFMFKDTRMLGVKIPFHVHFEEVNLRFYVRRFENGHWKRGVVFIKEIVPKPAITFVANTLYREKYETRPMRHRWLETEGEQTVEYAFKTGDEWQTFSATAAAPQIEIPAGSEAEFITEHYWGYARVNDYITNEYEVTHPRWQQYAVTKFEVEVDFERVYGAAFAHLAKAAPLSVMLAEGSGITVEGKRTIDSRTV
jgi:uncharacterized protein